VFDSNVKSLVLILILMFTESCNRGFVFRAVGGEGLVPTVSPSIVYSEKRALYYMS